MTNEEIGEEIKKILSSGNYRQGISVSLFKKVPSKKEIISLEKVNDESKAIDSKQWDALPPEAQKALKDQGFYPIIKITC